jgi:hypothetical protein
MKVRCIDNIDASNLLKKGQVYEVFTEVGGFYYLADLIDPRDNIPVTGGWLKHRFEEVVDSEAAVSTPATKKYAGKDCPCGMPSDQCEYHKGV